MCKGTTEAEERVSPVDRRRKHLLSIEPKHHPYDEANPMADTRSDTVPGRTAHSNKSRTQTRDDEGHELTVELLTRLVMEQRDVMLKVARRYSGRTVTAEDIVQEAFVVVCKNPHRLKEVESSGAWLVGVTRNLGRQAVRKRNRRGKLLRDHCNQLVGTEDPEPQIADRRVEEVLRAAKRLPERQRLTLQYMLVKGISDDEIATALGVAEATVRSYRFRAIRELRQMMVKKPGHR